jgi:RimJ/RimL family protein N-acetyltransferase
MRIETERLVLRDFVADDLPAYVAIQSDPRWLTHYEWEVRDPRDVEALLGLFLGHQRDEPRTKFQLAITLDGAVIGSCGIRKDDDAATQADIGYELHADHWGNGYAIEAATAMIGFGFRELGLHRVWSWCYADNERSATVLRRLGMTLEGRRRETQFFKGRWHDELVFGLLETEWPG